MTLMFIRSLEKTPIFGSRLGPSYTRQRNLACMNGSEILFLVRFVRRVGKLDLLAAQG